MQAHDFLFETLRDAFQRPELSTLDGPGGVCIRHTPSLTWAWQQHSRIRYISVLQQTCEYSAK